MVYGSTTGHHHYNESDYISVMELLFKRCSSSRVHTIAILPLEAKKIGAIESILQKVRQLTDGIYRWARYRKRLRTSLGFKLNRATQSERQAHMLEQAGQTKYHNTTAIRWHKRIESLTAGTWREILVQLLGCLLARSSKTAPPQEGDSASSGQCCTLNIT